MSGFPLELQPPNKHMRTFISRSFPLPPLVMAVEVYISSGCNGSFLTNGRGRVNDNTINMLLYQLEHRTAAIKLTRFFNRKNSSSTEASRAPDHEKKALSSGPKMHYWVKRVDEKKDPIVSSYQPERSARRLYLTPHLWKREVKSQGGMQRRPRRCLRQKTNKKRSNFNLYQGSHQIAGLSLFTSAFSENTDVSTTELNRKPRLQFSCQWTKHSLQANKW